MSVLILGKHGMLAHMVAYNFDQNGIIYDALGRPEICALNLDSLDVDFSKYNYVINCIGLTNRWEELSTREAFRAINSRFPLKLADECVAKNARLIHISTDCVFSGGPGPHYEDTIPDGQGDYAESKIAGEPLDQAMVIRTSIVGPEKANFYSLWSWVISQEGKLINGYKDHLWNGITSYQLAECLTQIVGKEQHIVGLRHLYSPETVSKFELLKMIVDASNLSDTRVHGIETNKPKDMRLASRYPDFVKKFNIPPLKAQFETISKNLQL